MDIDSIVKIQQQLETNDILFDGVYQISSYSCLSNYDQIYQDFQIAPNEIISDALIVGTLCIEEYESPILFTSMKTKFNKIAYIV